MTDAESRDDWLFRMYNGVQLIGVVEGGHAEGIE